MNKGTKRTDFRIPVGVGVALACAAIWQFWTQGPGLLPVVALAGAAILFILSIKTLQDEARHRSDTKNILVHKRALDRSRRLAVIGELAGGIADEVHSPLVDLQTMTENMLAKPNALQDPRFVQRQLSALLNRMDRIGLTIKALQNFSHRQYDEGRRVETLETLVHEAIALNTFRLKKAGVTLKVNFNGLERSEIYCRVDEFTQTVMGLLVNAIEAVSGQKDAWVEIEYHEQGDNFTLVVRNSGPPIPSEIAAHMFEPSFSTKGFGKSTGLGLSVASDLIRAHGGELVHNAKAKFTSFEIRMPKARALQSKTSSQSEAA